MGFPPVYDKESRVLILGSFPSVKSREISFYYGHKQNRFWKMLCGFFQEEIPETVEGKKQFLLTHKIALWDIATACEVQGSSDASIKNAEIADLQPIFMAAKIEKVLLNGTLAYDLFVSKYANMAISYQKMPSTSPANPRYEKEIWWRALNDVFKLY
ncbi:MAG: DNA-deoxyinosine glycosylase [Clostridia bacterium]|nr:DNA-deoxyinosine glycosylase [Clostridia bacterium]